MLRITSFRIIARRKFFDALDHQPTQAEWLVVEMRKLYFIERKAREEALTAAQRHDLRQRLAGIVVRNSIILVDFIEQRVAEGMPLSEAVVDAGAVRFRPMLLTAVVVGASVILADPIFQGLAIALMAGEIASLLISRMAVPVIYFMAYNRESKNVETRSKETQE